jgi:K+-sensing histidine kinase KdpD
VPHPVPFNQILAAAIEEAGSVAKSRHVSLGRAPVCPGFVMGVDNLLTKALRAMVETAVQFSHGGGRVSFSARETPTEINLILEAQGRSVPPHLIPLFFDVLAISEPLIPGGNLGLGPPVAQRILSLFGGSVTIENLDVGGIRLGVRMRSAPSVADSAFNVRY